MGLTAKKSQDGQDQRGLLTSAYTGLVDQTCVKLTTTVHYCFSQIPASSCVAIGNLWVGRRERHLGGHPMMCPWALRAPVTNPLLKLCLQFLDQKQSPPAPLQPSMALCNVNTHLVA